MCVIHTPPVTKKVEYSCTLRRKAEVETTDYVPGERVREWDGEGYVSFPDADDFSDTDWAAEYADRHMTPQMLLELLRETAIDLANGVTPRKAAFIWKHVAEECRGWFIEDVTVEPD